MLNFSGQTKRRVVNLGNKKQGYGNKNFLEQSRLQRQERELAKAKERATLVIQNHIRRYLDLKQNSEDVISSWISYDVNLIEDWNSWIIQFVVLSKWYLLKQNQDVINQVMDVLSGRLRDPPYDIKDSEVDGLMQALNKLFSSASNATVRDKIVIALGLLISKYGVAHVDNVASNMIEYLEKHDLSPTEQQDVIDLIFQVNTHDSTHAFFKVLTLDVFSKPNHRCLDILRNEALADDQTFQHFDQDSLVAILSNYLIIHGDEKFTELDFIFVASVLEHVHCVLKLQDEDDMDEDEEVIDSPVVSITEKISNSLDKLYSPGFVQGTVDLLRNKDPKPRTLALKILPELINLYPPLKGKICMLLSIIPNCYNWFFDTIKQHELFNLFVTSKNDYIKTDELEKFDKHSMDSFWQTVFLFEELYSYWLIVSNDLESFNDDKLPIDDVKQFLEFLKTLALTLIFASDHGMFPQYENLKSISIALLNQLYTKNLRMRFLPRDFWFPKQLIFNVDLLLSLIAEDEEKRILAYDEDDMDIEPQRKTKPGAPKDVVTKLEVLKKLPFFIAFKDRVKVFQALIELDKQRSVVFNPFSFEEPSLRAKINRDTILEDAFEAYHNQGSNFKNKIQVEFFNEYGREIGIDGGGITKEFLTSVVKEGFNPDNAYELFKETLTDNQIYPNDKIYEIIHVGMDQAFQQERLEYIRFLGMIIGKCLYENVLIDVSFAPFFLNKWCNDSMKNSINDLSYLDHELFVNLMKLTKMTDEELESLDLTFSVNIQIDSKAYVFDLLPNGSNVQVNASNILNYIHQIANFKLNQSLRLQTKYFLEGLYSMISSNWLSMFDCFELQMLISGGKSDINIDDWKCNVEYGGYLDNDPSIKMFWEIVEEMTPDERCKLIKFVTSVSRAPLLGFGALNPKFGIRNSGQGSLRLPTASTCVNLLKLPDYKDKKVMKEKLLYAINVDAGFDLS
ncbi:putative E3 ubiquitin-protein ligase HUL5 [Candida viswanathii]|uniref:HECT-type E3 ubiquitin transferase n=1 Tax=Candida viswanathii TaxID=5486 RepID=A0A367Y0A2_9ASCO|nr:putative E3 ubiquitin-protein ligase HUL5 [Candida viswanathii]